MMSDHACTLAARDDLIVAYCSGRLGGSELERFEVHLLGCAECGLGVREGVAVRRALRQRAVRRGVVVFASLAAAAASIVFMFHGGSSRLGAFDPPALEVMTTRGTTEEAFAAYQARDWTRAAERFARLAAESPSAGTSFYLGISLLLAGRQDEARVALVAVLATDNPYVADARYYLAKLWLQKSAPDSALAVLRARPDARARALVDSIVTRE